MRPSAVVSDSFNGPPSASAAMSAPRTSRSLKRSRPVTLSSVGSSPPSSMLLPANVSSPVICVRSGASSGMFSVNASRPGPLAFAPCKKPSSQPFTGLFTAQFNRPSSVPPAPPRISSNGVAELTSAIFTSVAVMGTPAIIALATCASIFVPRNDSWVSMFSARCHLSA